VLLKHVGHVCSATDSCGCKGDANKVRAGLTVLETIGDNTEGKSLNLRLGFFRGVSVSENSRQVNHFRNPATVFLLFNFHSELHSHLCLNKSYAFPLRLKRAFTEAG